jgi:hypothetical protein
VVSEPIWRKARRSQNSQNCVELRGTLDAVRDSKNAAGPALHGNMRGLIHAVRAGRLAR